MKTVFFLGFALLCLGSLQAQQAQALDDVIAESAKAVEVKLTSGSKLAVLNFSSGSDVFSDYVIEELSGVLVMSGKVTIVERRSLDLVRKEMDLQLSGEVSDDSAQAIGKQLGAQAIVSGSLTNMGSVYRFRIKVINVETARIEAQVSYNLRNDEQVAFLLHGNQQSAPPVASGTKPASAETASAAPPSPSPSPAASTPAAVPSSAVEAPAPVPSSTPASPGLYAGSTYQGPMNLYDALDWIALNAQNNSVYTIVLGSDQAASNIRLDYSTKRVTVTLKASGGERKIRFDTNSPSYALFTVYPGATFIMEDGVSLTGLSKDSAPLVRVEGGAFIMNGGALRDNKCSASRSGGGVYVNGGTFTMTSGTISGNAAGYGGGVYVDSGTFTMNGGTISGNTASHSYGGGVYVNGGTFTMNNGTISGNAASHYYGGGVYVDRGTFIKSNKGGIIYGSNAPEGQANKARSRGHAVYCYLGGRSRIRDTTARVTTALDSSKNGADGGWE
ncbi:MAG: hypothetical protein LBD29_01390 [Treponema sp.]|jgi:TolB-like protein|nr:hypothetical protein [Treponema sp.]